MKSVDSFRTAKTINVGTKTFSFYSLRALEQSAGIQLSHLPISLKILLENLLRREDGRIVRKEDIEGLAHWDSKAKPDKEIAFMPARVLLQDFTGVPCIVDLAVMRDAMIKMGGDPNKINPLQPVDLVIDHSVQVDEYGTFNAFRNNATLEFERNRERYAFLRWGQQAFKNFRVVPPDTGIVHQVNLEYLAQVVFSSQHDSETLAYPDTLVGTDSHTTMINGLGVLGWGVGGIEAEAAMLGQPISMLIPQVVGFKLHGKLQAGSTATDLVLAVTQMLRKKGVVGKFVEFFGPGLSSLSLADRATIANMAPEYGATMGFFPVDAETINFLRFTGRSEEQVILAEAYLKEQGLFHTADTLAPEFSDVLELNLASVEPSIAGPKRPQDRILLSKSKTAFRASLIEMLESKGIVIDKAAVSQWVYYLDDTHKPNFLKSVPVEIENSQQTLEHGSVVIAAITSCTNTSNPSVLITAGLLAKKASELGLTSKPWVKTSLAPGSKVVTEYLRSANLMEPLESLGFHLVGYGCMTCIGNSGPLPEVIAKAIQENDLVTAAVLSGNRNFEGRVHPLTRANYLASPPLVVAYALAGTMNIDFKKDSIGMGKNGEPVFLKDIWPSPQEVAETMHAHVKSEMFKKEYANVFEGEDSWKSLPVPTGVQYAWGEDSTYIKPVPFFENLPREPKPLQDIHNARVLALLGDSVTTDHISPAGSFSEKTPAGQYLMSLNVQKADFNQYGTRRGNHEVMMRGTFANIRLKNFLVPGVEGGITLHPSSQEPVSIFDAAMKYKEENTPLIILAGKEYGSGSSRDWAAKGPALLGVRAVIAESFERIHRSNLIGMGILPLQFEEKQNCASLGLTGFETLDIDGIASNLKPGKKLTVTVLSQDGSKKNFTVVCRIDTPNEVDYFKHGGILQYVLRSLLNPDQVVSEQPLSPARPTSGTLKNERPPIGTKQTYRILFNGEIEPGQELPEVKGRLAQLFKTTPEQIERLFSGKPVTINTNLDYTAAQEYIAEMKKAGALCYFEPTKIAPSPPPGNTLKKGQQPVSAKSGGSATPLAKNKPTTKAQPIAMNSSFHKFGRVLTAVGMLFILFLYIFFIFFIASTTYDHLVDNTMLLDGDSIVLGIIFYSIPFLVGVLLIIAMLKPLFFRPVSKRFSISFSRKKELPLFAFVDKICKSIGSKIPNTIEVDCSANASAGFRRGFTGFLEDDLIFTFGLPVASEMTLTEFTNLIAQEFGHCTEKLEMRIHYIITSVRNWFFCRIFEEDKIDQRLALESKLSSGFVRFVVLPFAYFLIWLSRKILTAFLFACDGLSRFYVRQMQFEADRYAVRLAGPEAFESSLQKLQILTISMPKAFSELQRKTKPTDDSLPDDFVLLVSSIAKQNSDPDISKAQEIALRNLKKIPEKNPSDQERIEKVKSLPVNAPPPSDASASTLFVNFNETSKIASMRLYREVLGLQVDPKSLIPTQDYCAPSEQAPDMDVTPEADDLNFFA